MTCREWEERIAEDLEDPAVLAHVAACARCQVFASGLRGSLEWLREAHADPLPAAAYGAVRARVVAELRSRRRWAWGWAWAAAAGAMALVVMAVGMRMRVAEMPAVALLGPGAPEEAVTARAASPERSMPARKPAWRAGGSLHQVVMKIESEEHPDVVIYWIAETKGDE